MNANTAANLLLMAAAVVWVLARPRCGTSAI
jgi:hypothetical protein